MMYRQAVYKAEYAQGYECMAKDELYAADMNAVNL